MDGTVCVFVYYTHSIKYLKHPMNLKLPEGLKNFSINPMNIWNVVKGFVINQISQRKNCDLFIVYLSI